MAPTTEPGASDPASVEPGSSSAPSLMDQIGGVPGLIYSALPILVFVPVNSVWGLTPAIVAALVAAAAIFLLRLIRREPLNPAISGLLGVAVCVFIAYRTGDAKGYFLFGIWATLIYGIVFVVSIAARWPLVGVIWNFVNGTGSGWRRDRRMLVAYDVATAFWALVFFARYFTQSQLYDQDSTGWLATARIGMGWPLTALAVLVTVALVSRAARVSR